MTDIYGTLRAGLDDAERAGLRRRRRLLQSPQTARVRVDGTDVIAFCSNDYLGLANHPALIEAAAAGARLHGVGAGASHLVLGHHAAHEALEHSLALFVGMPRAVLFSTGYMANVGVVTALVGRNDAVFADRLNHASLNDAALLSRADFRRYPHVDLAALERLLSASSAQRKLIVTDGVFSMDGDMAPLPALLGLAERYGAWLLVDDAHGFGVTGPQGRGLVTHFDLRSDRIIYMGTLGKAAGVFGAFVAAQEPVVDTLVQRAGSYIYTTALPPLLAHALNRSVQLIAEADDRRAHLRNLIDRLRDGLKLARWTLLPSDTAIQPVVIGDNNETVEVAAQLAERGLLVPAIRPPTVPRGTARLRISLSAAHTVADVDALVGALLELEQTRA